MVSGSLLQQYLRQEGFDQDDEEEEETVPQTRPTPTSSSSSSSPSTTTTVSSITTTTTTTIAATSENTTIYHSLPTKPNSDGDRKTAPTSTSGVITSPVEPSSALRIMANFTTQPLGACGNADDLDRFRLKRNVSSEARACAVHNFILPTEFGRCLASMLDLSEGQLLGQTRSRERVTALGNVVVNCFCFC